LIYLAVLALVSVVAYLVSNYLFGWSLSAYNALLGTTALSLIAVAVYAYRAHLHNIFIVLALFVGSMIFLPTTSFLFNSVLKEHQQNRIYSFLGIINDPQGIDFNVNQSKIAIGSGGMFGKGFLEGTQVKYNFVPENHTDFIFCTVGEEWGFLGCLVVLAMYGTLILRLMRIGERQEEPFGRIYCYCVASILLFHLMVNVGMTIGLMPVMGIPLPFMSYGGSSLLAFTLLLFIAIRFDAARRRFGVE
jgi:rod shape determining protein RodA